MKTPFYGEVDDKVLLEQEKGLSQLCPITEDEGEQLSGRGFTHSDKFLVSGDPWQTPPMKSNGRSNLKDRQKQAQGYKVHISAHPSQAVEVAQVVLPLLQQTSKGDNPLGGVNYKVAKLKEYALEDKPEAQGKFITIYAKDEEQLKLIAMTVQNGLLMSGITSQTHGGGLSTGDSKLGTTDMISMRFGQFTGTERDMVYLNNTWIGDDRKVPCPEVMKEEYNRVLSETNKFMEVNKQELLVVQQLTPNINTTTPSTRETYRGMMSQHRQKLQEEPELRITNSNTESMLTSSSSRLDGMGKETDTLTTKQTNITTNTGSTEKAPKEGETKEEKKTVGESFRKQRPKHTGGYFDEKTMKDVRDGRFPDDDQGGPGFGKGGPGKTTGTKVGH